MVPPWMLECREPAALLMNPYQSPQTPDESRRPRHRRRVVIGSLLVTLMALVPLNLLQAGGYFVPDPRQPWTGAIGFPVEFLAFTASGVRWFHFWHLVVDLLHFGALWGILWSLSSTMVGRLQRSKKHKLQR